MKNRNALSQRTTSIKLGNLHQDVIDLAKIKGCKPHKIMLMAIRQYVETETKQQDKILKQMSQILREG